MDLVEALGPIFTAQLYEKLEGMLLELLRSLNSEEWEVQTLVKDWKVKDVAAHLLDTQLRKLSIARDGYSSDPPVINSRDDLTAFVNRLNSEGVGVYRRLSSRVLIDLMEMASKQSADYHQSLDPLAPALFGVSWAGEESSKNWFDTAREFTERWHHQQQIRLAVNKPGIMTREFYYPVLDTFMRALPFHYRTIHRNAGTTIQFIVSGDCGGAWNLYRSGEIWELTASPIREKVAEITIPQEIAWRIFTKGIDRQSAEEQTNVEGDIEAGTHVLSMLAIIG
jgi:uncharacterized protein (TIGR03083 family)